MSMCCVHAKNGLEYFFSSLPVVGTFALKLRLNVWKDLARAIIENKNPDQVELSEGDRKLLADIHIAN